VRHHPDSGEQVRPANRGRASAANTTRLLARREAMGKAATHGAAFLNAARRESADSNIVRE
jgi:hypothetical protein